jgi:hypothetical protein
MKKTLVPICLMLLLSAVNASAVSRPECAGFAAGIEPYIATVNPHEGRRVSIASLPGALRATVQAEGGAVYRLGSGAYGTVYRWESGNGTPIVAKVYRAANFASAEESAATDEAKLAVLRSVSEPDDFVQIVQPARDPLSGVRFYNYVHGDTLRDMSRIRISQFFHRPARPLRNILYDGIQDYLDTLMVRLRQRYGQDNVAPSFFGDGTTFEVQVNGEWLYFKLHSGNWVLDVDDLHLWIIDPR